MPYNAFISHASADVEKAERVSNALRRAGYRTYFAPSDATMDGKRFGPELIRAIDDSELIVVLLTPNVSASEWVAREVHIAKKHKRDIQAVRLEAMNLPDDFPEDHPLYFEVLNLNWIDLAANWRVGIKRLKNRVGKLEYLADAAAKPTSVASKAGKAKPATAAQPSAQSAPPLRDPPPKSDQVMRAPPLQSLERRAEMGEKSAQYILGRLYLDGENVPVDRVRAARLLRLAADGDKGLPQAQHLLADCYRKGWGVGRDLARMRSLYERAAQQGYPPAFYRLGMVFDEGLGVPQDKGRAYRRFESAARLGFAPAQVEIAQRSLHGVGVPVNHANALTHAQRAAREQYGPALNLMGRLYRHGCGVPQDDAIACDWYRKAIDQGDLAAMHNLSTMYERGLGVEQDDEMARVLRQQYEEWTRQTHDG